MVFWPGCWKQRHREKGTGLCHRGLRRRAVGYVMRGVEKAGGGVCFWGLRNTCCPGQSSADPVFVVDTDVDLEVRSAVNGSSECMDSSLSSWGDGTGKETFSIPLDTSPPMHSRWLMVLSERRQCPRIATSTFSCILLCISLQPM